MNVGGKNGVYWGWYNLVFSAFWGTLHGRSDVL